jgi:hypothetical protein
MRFAHRALALALAALLAVAAAAQGTAAAALAPQGGAGARELAYHLDWGPLPLAEIRIRLEAGADGGRTLTAQAESLGVARLFADFAVEQTSRAQADGSRFYVSEGRWGGEARRRLVAWPGPEARPRVDHAGNPPEGPRTPIPEAELEGVVDPGTAILRMLDRVAAGEGCGGTWRLYDGVRRLDLTVTDEGTERLEADRDWTYSGPARRCRLNFARVGGFEADEPRETAESDYDRRLWIAELPGGVAPVRLSVSWPLGAAVGRLDLRPAP